jgi:hypothetical protein
MAPRQGEEVYDPCCGSGGLLIKCQLALKEPELKIDRPLKLHGQELTGSSFAIARMNMVLHDMTGEIVRGNTMANPKFLDDSRLRRFDIVVTNPMWNQDNFDPKSYENDSYERFESRGGFAPGSSADWAWLQHVAASLTDKGRAAVVIDTGAASRGSGNHSENKEKSIRRWFVEQDLIECVIQLPENLFYNTTAPGLVFLLNMRKSQERQGQILFVNASAEFRKLRPKNELTDEGIRTVIDCFRQWIDREGLCRVVSNHEIAQADYTLSPSRVVRTAAMIHTVNVQPLLDKLTQLGIESESLSSKLSEILWQKEMLKQLHDGIPGALYKDTEIGAVPEDWEVTTLGALCTRNDGSIQTGPFGSQLHAYEYQTEGVPVINPTHLGGNRINHADVPRVSRDIAARLERHRVEPGDILFGRRGEIGRHGLVSDAEAGWICGTGCFLVRLRSSEVDNAFLSYWFSTKEIVEWLVAHAAGTIMPNLNNVVLNNLPVAIPDISEQRRIVAIVDVINRKLDLQREELGVLEKVSVTMLHSLMAGTIAVKKLVLQELTHA